MQAECFGFVVLGKNCIKGTLKYKYICEEIIAILAKFWFFFSIEEQNCKTILRFVRNFREKYKDMKKYKI